MKVLICDIKKIFFLFFFFFFAFSSEWSLRAMKKVGGTCDDIISPIIFFFAEFLFPFLPFSLPKKKLSDLAFTIRYMARKNLIQFWVSSHFFSLSCAPTPPPSPPSWERIFLLLPHFSHRLHFTAPHRIASPWTCCSWILDDVIIAISIVRLNAPQKIRTRGGKKVQFSLLLVFFIIIQLNSLHCVPESDFAMLKKKTEKTSSINFFPSHSFCCCSRSHWWCKLLCEQERWDAEKKSFRSESLKRINMHNMTSEREVERVRDDEIGGFLIIFRYLHGAAAMDAREMHGKRPTLLVKSYSFLPRFPSRSFVGFPDRKFKYFFRR